MSASDSFDDVVGRLREGDEDAAAEILRRFTGRLIALARGRLQGGIRAKLDPEDVLQSVFRSFFVRQAQGQFEVEDWDGLWSLLARITLRKCGRQIGAFRADRRDIRREVGAVGSDDESRRSWEAVAHEPTPQEVTLLTEMLEQLMRGLDETQRQVVVLRLQGFTVSEISQQISRTERTVQRVLAQVRERLKRLEQESL
jgi:RNA polymerase sigma-70 factor, ECF subfamily